MFEFRRFAKFPDLEGCPYCWEFPAAMPDTTEAYEDLRGMKPGAPVGMPESGTPGEPEGYEFVILKVCRQ